MEFIRAHSMETQKKVQIRDRREMAKKEYVIIDRHLRIMEDKKKRKLEHNKGMQEAEAVLRNQYVKYN